MKKLILFLLLPLWAIAQTTTGQEQEFDYGIKNNSTQTITTPPYLTTTGMDGTQGKIPSALIAKTSDIADSLATKENIANKSDSYTTSSSITYASTAALVGGLSTKANDAETVHKTGNETVAGNKTLSGTTTLNETIIREGYRLIFPRGVMYQSSVGTNALTGNRTVSFPDASGSVALISQTVTNGVLTSSPSQDAVFDALDGKQATLGFTPENLANKSDSYTVSSSTTYASTKALVDGLGTKIEGSGTTNYIPKFTASGTVENSNATSVGSVFSINGTLDSNGLVTIGKITGSTDTVIIGGVSGVKNLKITDGVGMMQLYSSTGAENKSGFYTKTNMALFAGSNNSTVSPTGNGILISSSGRTMVGTTTDNGVDMLQINGSTKTTALTLDTAPTTSAGTYDILTRNTSTRVVEKILSNTIATVASPTFTGTPTAPTAPVGTTGNQIATLDYVLANSSVISGTYIPTLVNVNNTSSSSTDSASFSRVGNYVTARVSFFITPTSSLGTTVIDFSLPVSRTSTDIIGIGTGSSFLSPVVVNTINNTSTARLSYTPSTTGRHQVVVMLQYSVN